VETNGRELLGAAVGPLRRLVAGRGRARPVGHGRIHRFGIPLLLVAIAGMGLGNASYVQDTRNMGPLLAALFSFWTVLPAALAIRWPLLAWRIGYPLLYLGVIGEGPKEAWPWTPVHIFAALFVFIMLGTTEEPGVTGWAVAASLVPVLLFAEDGNAQGATVALVAFGVIGELLARRREGRRALAEQTELSELERARRAILEERTRIAREMHDVVAHHMSMIAVRAETAPYRVTGLDEPAKVELAEIAGAARQALTDMRRLLGVLRSEDGEAPTAPQPGLADLPGLVTTAQAAGIDVTFSSEDLVGVPEAVGLTAYRIVQEALANAARHAPGGPVSIVVRGLADRMEITVRNRRTEAATGGAGHGLIGMRERVALLGGELTAEPDRFDFVVQARLPFGPADGRGADS
jgi:signal transduction histidine kinase